MTAIVMPELDDELWLRLALVYYCYKHPELVFVSWDD